MRIWGVFCLLGCITILNAHGRVTDETDTIEDKSSVGVVPHIDNKSHVNNSLKKTERPHLLKEKKVLADSKEEKEKPESYLILTTEKLSPPGGGLRMIDPKMVNDKPPPTPSPEVSWWERWWSWLLGESI